MSALTNRERVRIALNHEEPDRVPVDFGGSRITGIGVIACKNLLWHLGLREEIRVYDLKQQLAEPSLEVISRLGSYVFAPIHNIQPDIPPEKVLAIYDTVAACVKYPLA